MDREVGNIVGKSKNEGLLRSKGSEFIWYIAVIGLFARENHFWEIDLLKFTVEEFIPIFSKNTQKVVTFSENLLYNTKHRWLSVL